MYFYPIRHDHHSPLGEALATLGTVGGVVFHIALVTRPAVFDFEESGLDEGFAAFAALETPGMENLPVQRHLLVSLPNWLKRRIKL